MRVGPGWHCAVCPPAHHPHPVRCPCQPLTPSSWPYRYLEYTLDSTKIRRQDATSTINSIASNVVGQPLAWDFIRGNWRKLFTQ